MGDKPYVSPLDIHRNNIGNEEAAPFQFQIPGPNPTGAEIACVVGGINEEPIPALFHAPSRTVYPVRS